MTRYGACMKIPFDECQSYKKGKIDTPCYAIKQKGVDVRFSIDLVSLATDKKIDKAILITGDSDFIPAINYARETGMKIFLYCYKSKKHATSGREIFYYSGLWYACDERVNITPDLFQDCLI